MSLSRATSIWPGSPRPPEQVIAGVYDASHAVALQPPANLANDAFAYTQFGPAGTVAHQEHVKDLDVHLIEFANGVRLNLKKTDFEADTIHVRIRVGTGKLTEPAQTEPGLAFLANLTFITGGLGKHSVDDLQRLFASKTVGLNFNVGDDAFVLGGTTNREDLLAQLQLLTAYFVDPGLPARGAAPGRGRSSTRCTTGSRTPRTGRCRPRCRASSRAATRASACRRSPPPWAARSTKSAPGSAPNWPTAPSKSPSPAIWTSTRPLQPWRRRSGRCPRARPNRSWPRRGSWPSRRRSPGTSPCRRRFPRGSSRSIGPPPTRATSSWPAASACWAEIFSDRLRVKVREEMGDAYSPEAGSAPSDTYTDYGFMLAQITVDPAQAQKIVDTVLAIAADLQKNGATPDELERAKQPILTSLKESARTNGYWLNNVIGSCQEFPQRLDWCRTRYSDFEGITKAEIDALAAQYLDPARTFRVIVLPAGPPPPPA